ncbi:acyl carrier protein, partial [Streptomyces kanamyceticus]|uniref:acyl carrier protein n=1 Tax=Streptomyces kanamyceticus TaxID=1967 RepID=UPI000AF447AB
GPLQEAQCRARQVRAAGRPGVAMLPQPSEAEAIGTAFLLDVLGRLWTAGEDVDWAAYHQGESVRRVPLPSYPFDRARHWIEPHGSSAPAPRAAGETLRDRFEGMADAEKVALLTAFIRKEIAGVIGAPDPQTVDLDTNLFDMGLDSLILIEVIAKLGDQLAHEVRSSAFVEYPTVRSFVADLSGELGIAPDAPTATPAAGSDGRVSRRAQRAAARRPAGS